MKNVVPSLKKFKKSSAIELRKKGFSYSEIQKKLEVPKSTLSLWLKGVNLTEEQSKKLNLRRREIAKANSEKRILRTHKLIEEIKESSSKDIDKISKRELWLMGIVLYWRERSAMGNETDIKNGVRFTSSNPELIKLFLDWLQEIGGITDREIKLDIFVSEKKKYSIQEIIAYWSKVSGFPESYFHHFYFQKDQSLKNKKISQNIKKSLDSNQDDEESNISKKDQFGLLRIRVRASSMLARQISGWIRGIQRYYKY